MFRLEMGSFPVEDIRPSDRTAWRDGILEVNLDELLGLVREDPRIGWASVDVTQPGESVRVVNVTDIWAPMVKVAGPGQTYPAVSNRSTAMVGQGRTHRLDGVGIVECTSLNPYTGARPLDNVFISDFIDMSGPGSNVRYGRLRNVCLSMEPAEGVDREDFEDARRTACLKVSDRLTQTTVGLEPPRLEVFDTSTRNPALPGFVHVTMLASSEQTSGAGARSKIGMPVYGLTRLSMPWLLHPTEVLDGAIVRGQTWYQVNNPNVLHLARGHGKEWNFLGVIVGRTNWTSMLEKEVLAHRIGELARSIGASGAIVTVNLRGARFVETVLSAQALELAGVKTALLTLEETSEDGQAPPLLMSVPELVSVVSAGDGSLAGPFPAVQRVIGARDPQPVHFAERPGVLGGYGEGRYWTDYYGGERYSGVDY